MSLRVLGMPGQLGPVRRLATGKDSLIPNIPLARLVARSLAMDMPTFGDLQRVRGVRV